MVGRFQLARAWLRSAGHRRAFEIWRQQRRIFRLRRDALPPEVGAALAAALGDLRAILNAEASTETLDAGGRRVQALAAEWLRPARFHRVAEGVETFLIILVLVLVIRTFFLMPSAIPTGSMQPTLYGVTVQDRRKDAAFQMAGPLRGLVERFVYGREYFQVVARAAGQLKEVRPPEARFSWLPLPWLQVQRFRVGAEWYTIPAPFMGMPQSRPGVPELEAFLRLAGVNPRHVYQPGETILQAVLQAGDRLLVDRLTYHFRRPRRGEIVVFQPHNVKELENDTYYLKRLVGLPGERIRLGDDRRVWINGEPLSDQLPEFRKLYAFDEPPGPGRYSGHLNERQARRFGPGGRGLAPFFRNGGVERQIPADAVVLLGDNTFESSDSRHWGPVAEHDVVGRVGWVYWPWSGRIGRGFE